MRKTQEQKIRDMRTQLGTAMRRADGVVGPLRDEFFDRNVRWEEDEVVRALVAVDELGDDAGKVEKKLLEILRQKFTRFESERLLGARRGIGKAREFLGSIKQKQIGALLEGWYAGKLGERDGHETYLLSRFMPSMKILQLSWNKMLYATSFVVPIVWKLDKIETVGFYNEMSDVYRIIRERAELIADREGNYVEVMDADGRIGFVAAPPIERMEFAQRAAKTKKVKQVMANPTPSPMTKAENKMFEAIWSMKY